MLSLSSIHRLGNLEDDSILTHIIPVLIAKCMCVKLNFQKHPIYKELSKSYKIFSSSAAATDVACKAACSTVYVL